MGSPLYASLPELLDADDARSDNGEKQRYEKKKAKRKARQKIVTLDELRFHSLCLMPR